MFARQSRIEHICVHMNLHTHFLKGTTLLLGIPKIGSPDFQNPSVSNFQNAPVHINLQKCRKVLVPLWYAFEPGFGFGASGSAPTLL